MMIDTRGVAEQGISIGFVHAFAIRLTPLVESGICLLYHCNRSTHLPSEHPAAQNEPVFVVIIQAARAAYWIMAASRITHVFPASDRRQLNHQ
jgi:hypothetical protein